jgi:hypothetical protein
VSTSRTRNSRGKCGTLLFLSDVKLRQGQKVEFLVGNDEGAVQGERLTLGRNLGYGLTTEWSSGIMAHEQRDSNDEGSVPRNARGYH